MFEIEVGSFCRDESLWPEINYKTFVDWFSVDIHHIVFDPYDDEIVNEEFLDYKGVAIAISRNFQA